jgi:tetratricopeptide (TPR) repeat protein
MYETEGIDGLVCQSPNETILFNDENDLNKFMNLLKNNNFESLKQLGDLMIIRKYYEKSIYYYESVLKLKNDNLLIKSKILSNLSENYIQYKYYSKGLEFINKSFDIIKIILKNNVEQIDQKFLIKLFFRKLRCFIGLRNFKEAYEYLEKIKNAQDLKNFYKLDESFIKEFLNNNEIKNLTKMINKGYDNFLGNLSEIIQDKSIKSQFYSIINLCSKIEFKKINNKIEIKENDENKNEIIEETNINTIKTQNNCINNEAIKVGINMLEWVLQEDNQ